MDLILFHKSGKRVLVKDKNISENTAHGAIDRKQLIAAKNGDVLKTSKGEEYNVVVPDFKEQYLGMKNGAQCIRLKDCGLILAETLVGKDSVCLDCGSGMGGLTCFLARYVKKVYSYDYKELHHKNSVSNAEKLGLKNIEFGLLDIYNEFPKKLMKGKLDLMTLDLIEPYKLVETAKSALKVGGRIVAYCPQVTQMEAFVKEIQNSENFEYLGAKENMVRNWKIEGKVLRPDHTALVFTGFLCFGKRIR